MVRIAQVIGKLSTGGVEAVVTNYYRAIDTARFQFDYIIDDNSEYDLPEALLERGARCFRAPSSKRPLRRVWALAKLFRAQRYPIVHAHMNALNLPVLLAARIACVPVRISHCHSTAAREEGVRTLLKQLLRPTAGWFATARFACGEQAARWLFGDACFNRGGVTLIPNAIDTGAFRYDPDARKRFRDEHGIPAEAFVIGHAGRFARQKNHAFLVDCFARYHASHPDSRLLLVGDGKLMEEVRRQTEALGIAEAVVMTGACRDMRSAYSAMDVLALPSLYEGLPMVALEAQAAGLPVLMSDRVTMESAVTRFACFLPIQEGTGPWAEGFERARAEVREGFRYTLFDEICASGRDIADVVRILEQSYDGLLAGRKQLR